MQKTPSYIRANTVLNPHQRRMASKKDSPSRRKKPLSQKWQGKTPLQDKETLRKTWLILPSAGHYLSTGRLLQQQTETPKMSKEAI